MSPDPGSVSLRAWAWLMLLATALLCAAIAAFNAVVDPTAQLGSGVFEPVAAGPRDRTAKVALLERDPLPAVVVLGSSRTKKLDPEWLPVSGVNAAVVGGDLFEARVFAAWLADLAERRDEPMPLLVVGVDVEQFRDSSLQGSGFLDVPELAAIARAEASGSDGSIGDELDRLERLLLTWQVTKASAASVRARARQSGGDTGAGAGAGREESGFTQTGVPQADARWFDPAQAARFARATPGRVEQNIAELRATYDSIGADLDPDAVDDLRALVEIVRRSGADAGPVLYVTPAHPELVATLDPLGRAERRRRVLRLLHDLRPGQRILDCTECIDGDAVNWIDATHPSPVGARMLAGELAHYLPSP